MRHTWLPTGLAIALSVLTVLGFARRHDASAAAETRAIDEAHPMNVVLELFTSEGCSSCPPADAALARLVQRQPVPGVTIVPLALHVDYWNDLGWPDPFSTPGFTTRQRDYAATMRRDGIYTPQAIVDGDAQRSGSDEAGLVRAITAAAAKPKATVAIERGSAPRTIVVRVGALPAGVPDARVTLAITEDGLRVDVPRGENAGRHLDHEGVARELRSIGSVRAAGGSLEASIHVPAGARRDRLRVVALVDDPRTRHVIGVGTLAKAGEFE